MMSSSWELLFSAVIALLCAAIGLYSMAVPQGDRRWWLLAAAAGGLSVAALALTQGVARVVLLDLAALCAVGLVWVRGTVEARRAARTYLALLLLSIFCIGAGLAVGGLLGEEEAARPAAPLAGLVLGLLIAGFGLKLALVPLYFWLPAVAEHATPMTTAIVVSVVDVAAFAELAHLRVAGPWLFEGRAGVAWLAIALLSMIGGALLALAQRDMKRMLAFSTIDDMGYLLLGVVAGPSWGLAGALAGALNHGLCKTLLFGAVGAAEHGQGGPLRLDDEGSRGLMARYPVAGATFIVGMLGMLGIPPTIGFAGRFRLYLAGAQTGPWALALMLFATGLALLYYVRAVHRVWFGRGPAPALGASAAGVPKPAALVLIVLAALALLPGFWPALITRWLP